VFCRIEMCLAAAKNRTTILGCPSHGLVTIATAYISRLYVVGGGGGLGGRIENGFTGVRFEGLGGIHLTQDKKCWVGGGGALGDSCGRGN
jgi:hypothetical protein